MKKRHQAGKRIAAWLMALSLCMTAVPAEHVIYAASGQNETEVTEDVEQVETTAVTQESEATEKTGTESGYTLPWESEKYRNRRRYRNNGNI